LALNNTAFIVANFRASRPAAAAPTATPPLAATRVPALLQPYRVFLSWVQ
jgi:hypothetical protein